MYVRLPLPLCVLCRVGHWLSAQCSSEECVEAHTNVDVVVDIPEFKALLESRLPFVWNGSTVRQAGLAWPGWIDV